MKSQFDKVYDAAIDKWLRDYRGHGSIDMLKPLDYTDFISMILQRLLYRTPDASIIIIVDGYNTRQNIINKLKLDNVDIAKVTVLSKNYISPRYDSRYTLAISCCIEEWDYIIEKVFNCSKWNLFIITNDKISSENLNKIYNSNPCISINVNNNDLINLSLSSPVEETRVECQLSQDDKEEMQKCDIYIKECISIFGDFSTIEKARVGNKELNVSAIQVCETVAKNNGWNEDIDTTIPFYKQIDDIFNPNNLKEKADTFYNIIRKRSLLCTDNEVKLEAIYNIIKNNPNKRFVIISKRGEFAAKITEYLNDKFDYEICGDYHDSIKERYINDDNGLPIVYKSGVNKGMPKLFKSQAISTYNLGKYKLDSEFINKQNSKSQTDFEPVCDTFNLKLMSCLSIKNSSNSGLEISCDGLILTSPLCDNIKELKYRFNKIIFASVPNIVYKVYLKNTIEEKALNDDKTAINVNYIIKNDNENYDENNCGIVC